MRSLRFRVIFVVLALALAAGASATLLFPVKTHRSDLKAEHLPLHVGSWWGAEGKIDDYVKEILETDDVVIRDYNSPDYPGAYVEMGIVYSPDNRRVAHPPEVCYIGADWQLDSKQIIDPGSGLPRLVRLVMSYHTIKHVILYCYKSGPDITANYYQQQWNIITNKFTKRSTASAMIRFSSKIIDNEDKTQERILALMRVMMPEIQKTLND